jgi:rhodanese-related sulfurtransferase
MIKKSVIITILSLLLLVSSTAITGCSYITGEALTATPTIISEVKDITPQQANTLSMISAYRVYFIDVRTPQEYAAGHIGWAINIDYSSPDFKSNIEKLAKDNVYIIYCLSGVRSAAASKFMVGDGFLRINNMTGGFSAWVAAGFPIEK